MQKSINYIQQLPTADLHDFHRFGHIPVIYFILDQYFDCIYIGRAKDMVIRFNNYVNCDREKWNKFKEFGATQIAWIHYHETENLHQDEQEWIELINPPLNDNNAPNFTNSDKPKRRGPIFYDDLVTEFAELRFNIRKKRAKADQMQKEVVSFIKTHNQNKKTKTPQIETPWGTLKVTNQNRWDYSQKTKDLEEKLKYQKQIERNNEIAKFIGYESKVTLQPREDLLEELNENH
jgi:hypothetical protein